MDFMIFPRLLSLAERAWHKASWEDTKNEAERNEKKNREWKTFSNFLVNHELPRLDKLGVKYRLPLPGARFVKFTFLVHVHGTVY
jgi:hexosaminidase